MTRAVTIRSDTQSTLWMIRCSTPCDGNVGWCMGYPHDQRQAICFLGSGLDQASATAAAISYGYTVEAAP